MAENGILRPETFSMITLKYDILAVRMNGAIKLILAKVT